MPPLLLAANLWDEFAIGSGVAAAVLIVGGVVLLRFQRNRYEFALMQAAMEKGITSPGPQQPAWLISLRQGFMTFTLGLALAAVGGATWWLADVPDLPRIPATQPSAEVLTSPKPRDEQGRLRPEGRLYTIAKSQWERAQNQRTIGMSLVGCGAVLMLLGVARMAFARAEKQHADELSGTGL